MEKTKTLKSTIYSALAVVCAIMVAFMFTACANIDDLLKQEATYNKDVIYTEDVDAAESQAVIDYITDRVQTSGTALTKFELMSNFRYTLKLVSSAGVTEFYVNAVTANREAAGKATISNDTQKENANVYVKDNVIYLEQIKESGEHIKKKDSKKEDAYFYSLGSKLFPTSAFVHEDLDAVVWTSIKKSGKNYRFQNDDITMIVQFDSSNRIMALAFSETEADGATITEVFSIFEGSLSFPGLDGYTEDD